MNRRDIITSGGIASITAFLAACAGGNPLNGPAQVDVKTAQMWSQELTDAADGFVQEALPAIGPKLTAAQLTQIQDAVLTLNASNQAFQTQGSALTDVKGVVLSIIKTAQMLATLLAPLYPPIAAVLPAIDVAVLVLTAFVNSIAIVVPPVPASLHRAALAHRHG